MLLAAGRSQRFGPRCKLQASFHGKPLVRHAAEAILGTGFPIVAVVADPAVGKLLPEFQIVYSDGPQSQSLQAGLQHIAKGPALIVLGDMPHVDTNLLSRIAASPLPAAASDGTIICPPACIPQTLFPALASLTGDQGAGTFLRSFIGLSKITVPPRILKDIDFERDILSDQPDGMITCSGQEAGTSDQAVPDRHS